MKTKIANSKQPKTIKYLFRRTKHSTLPLKTKVETNTMDDIISDGSGTLTHEEVMFSPAVAAYLKRSNVPQSFFAKDDSDEEGDRVVAGGPHWYTTSFITQF